MKVFWKLLRPTKKPFLPKKISADRSFGEIMGSDLIQYILTPLKISRLVYNAMLSYTQIENRLKLNYEYLHHIIIPIIFFSVYLLSLPQTNNAPYCFDGKKDISGTLVGFSEKKNACIRKKEKNKR